MQICCWFVALYMRSNKQQSLNQANTLYKQHFTSENSLTGLLSGNYSHKQSETLTKNDLNMTK